LITSIALIRVIVCLFLVKAYRFYLISILIIAFDYLKDLVVLIFNFYSFLKYFIST